MDAIKRRRSIPRFTDADVEDEKIDLLLELMRTAPSAHNQQPWLFYVVKKKEALTQIAKWYRAFKYIKSAPVIIVACGDRNSRYHVHDTSLALSNLMHGAIPLGLGTHWTSPFKFPGKDKDKGIRELLNIPDKYAVIALVALGYPDQEYKAKKRKLKTVDDIAKKVY